LSSILAGKQRKTTHNSGTHHIGSDKAFLLEIPATTRIIYILVFPAGEVMQTFTPPNKAFEITLPPSWRYEFEDGCFTLFDAEAGVGALVMNVFDFGDAVNDSLELLKGVLEQNKMPVDSVGCAEIARCKAALADFRHEGQSWLQCMVVRGTRALYLTYNCPEEMQDRERKVIDTALDSLVFRGTDCSETMEA